MESRQRTQVAECAGHGAYRLGIHRVPPDAALLHRGTNDESVSVGELLEVRWRNAGADKHRRARCPRHVAYFVGRSRLPRRRAGDDDPIGEEELRGFGCLDDRYIRGDRVRAVLLLDVSENQYLLRADRAAVAEQL